MVEENKITTIKVSLENGFFEVSGSEDFVMSQIEHLERLVSDFYCKNRESAQEKDIITKEKAEKTSKGDNNLDIFFEIKDDEVILTVESIPGKTKKDKIINAALLYLLGVNTLQGKTEVNKKEILNICETYGCKDSANFANHIRSAKGSLILKGGNVSITKPGIFKAKELIKNIDE